MRYTLLLAMLALVLASCGSPPDQRPVPANHEPLVGEIFLEGPIVVVVSGQSIACLSDVVIIKRDEEIGRYMLACDTTYNRFAWFAPKGEIE